MEGVEHGEHGLPRHVVVLGAGDRDRGSLDPVREIVLVAAILDGAARLRRGGGGGGVRLGRE